MWVAFANAKATHFFSKNIGIYAIFNDQSFNDLLSNSIISFEQLGPGPWDLVWSATCMAMWENMRVEYINTKL